MPGIVICKMRCVFKNGLIQSLTFSFNPNENHTLTMFQQNPKQFSEGAGAKQRSTDLQLQKLDQLDFKSHNNFTGNSQDMSYVKN